MKDFKKITRRRHAPDLKAKILSECDQPGASSARVAMNTSPNSGVVSLVVSRQHLQRPVSTAVCVNRTHGGVRGLRGQPINLFDRTVLKNAQETSCLFPSFGILLP